VRPRQYWPKQEMCKRASRVVCPWSGQISRRRAVTVTSGMLGRDATKGTRTISSYSASVTGNDCVLRRFLRIMHPDTPILLNHYYKFHQSVCLSVLSSSPALTGWIESCGGCWDYATMWHCRWLPNVTGRGGVSHQNTQHYAMSQPSTSQCASIILRWWRWWKNASGFSVTNTSAYNSEVLREVS